MLIQMHDYVIIRYITCKIAKSVCVCLFMIWNDYSGEGRDL